ncbi:MAG: phosphoribosylformylglycinamidine synthase subunit PurL [Bacillota bacterium]
MSAEPWREVGLTASEYARLLELLGRDPTSLELGMFGLMWSEHCSYKTSRLHLKQLPTSGPRVLQGPGENAGIVDIGDGQAIAFKIESHNHPSAIEPYQGAATGVGGILRDIFTMGARPIAILDSLRFGDPSEPRVRHLFDGVVSGIAGYGNCVGVPTVGGEVVFDRCYQGNPLVNVMCVGLITGGRVVRGLAAGPGNPVLLVGARTGRDGIHGASLLASQELDASAQERRPAVQVGDPFLEKLLLEACLELAGSDEVVGIQDLGAAGLTSAAAEAASRAGTGVELDVALVPRREGGMVPYEVMLSESQERMLVVAKAGSEDKVKAVFRRWGLDATVIGRVTGDGRFKVRDGEELVADIPVEALTQRAPAYDRPRRRPERAAAVDPLLLPEPANYAAAFLRVVGSPNCGTREWVYRQYDHMVQTNTVALPGGDAAVLRLKGTAKAIALSTDGNGRYCYLDPRRGAALAVAEAARNVSCVGAEPIAVTNCLNFGNPEKPEIMWQFTEAVSGMAEACTALGTPVTGGNVSFYNDTEGRSIYPTPVVGMLGLLTDVNRICGTGFRRTGDCLFLLGETRAELGGGEYLHVVHGLVAGDPPDLDLAREAALQAAVREAIAQGLLASAHDLSDGGLAVALAESCLAAAGGARGARVDLGTGLRPDWALFSESATRVLVSAGPAEARTLTALLQARGVPCTALGAVGDGSLTVAAGSRLLFSLPISEVEAAWKGASPCMFL